jgi:hypothetical protein
MQKWFYLIDNKPNLKTNQFKLEKNMPMHIAQVIIHICILFQFTMSKKVFFVLKLPTEQSNL